MTFCLDTNICIYYLKGLYPILLKKMMEKSPHDINIPSIVKAELFYGAEKSNKQNATYEKIYEFLIPFEIIPFVDKATLFHAKIKSSLTKKGTPIGPNDLLIAAITMSIDAVLVTNNISAFNRVNGLRLENWTE